ncbi:hypothetical protein D187_006182 [Cystobacter fuscus DSM 2262]|uniref:Phosphate-selective porin O and P n=1 Tax=Cystobacter fuscus (strain ATCC 25194 / DSM 2262 / NBRC 100088 / M29) TaxID=1242864 RepID=S9R4F4_CYSF2|nr:hypothetical protein [Cystobacter fuscus]EPX63773.1 hypothetical protein D187_006182 [Cystobacter fuscus DSM 2262]
MLSALLLGSSAGAQTGVPPASVGETEAPPPNKESGEAAKPPPPQILSDVPSFEMGGVVRFNYSYKSWLAPEHPNNRVGPIIFDILALRPRAQYKNLSLKADFHFHSSYAYLRYGYLAYKASDSLEIQAGLSQAPFGILPVPANNWFDNLAFYIGLEDDSDLGAKAQFKAGALDVQLAFYKSDEGNFFGRSIDSARYGFDLVRTNDTEVSGVGERTDRETDQGNVRLAYTFQHAESFQTEIGLSGMAGGIYNAQTKGMGWRWAAAAHVHGQYGPLGLQFQALSYAFNPAGPPEQDRRYVVMGAFESAYKVASRAHMFIANISYTWLPSRGLISSVVVYNDYALMPKLEHGFVASQQNVTGCHVAAGPVHAFLELISGRNHPFLGGDSSALAEGREDAAWGFRPNLSLGYVF